MPVGVVHWVGGGAGVGAGEADADAEPAGAAGAGGAGAAEVDGPADGAAAEVAAAGAGDAGAVPFGVLDPDPFAPGNLAWTLSRRASVCNCSCVHAPRSLLSAPCRRITYMERVTFFLSSDVRMIVAGALRFCGFGRMRSAAATNAGIRLIATVICTGDVVFFAAGGRACVVVGWRVPPRPEPRGRPRGRPRTGAVGVLVLAAGVGVPGVAAGAAGAVGAAGRMAGVLGPATGAAAAIGGAPDGAIGCAGGAAATAAAGVGAGAVGTGAVAGTAGAGGGRAAASAACCRA